MNTQSATKGRESAQAVDLKEVNSMVIPGEGEGVSPILVVYEPIYEPLLLRNHPTRRYAYLYELVPIGGGRFARGPLMSASVVDVGALN